MKNRRVEKHFGDVGEEMRIQGKKIREKEEDNPTSMDSPQKKAKEDVDESSGVGLSAGAASSRDPPNTTRQDNI